MYKRYLQCFDCKPNEGCNTNIEWSRLPWLTYLECWLMVIFLIAVCVVALLLSLEHSSIARMKKPITELAIPVSRLLRETSNGQDGCSSD